MDGSEALVAAVVAGGVWAALVSLYSP